MREVQSDTASDIDLKIKREKTDAKRELLANQSLQINPVKMKIKTVKQILIKVSRNRKGWTDNNALNIESLSKAFRSS